MTYPDYDTAYVGQTEFDVLEAQVKELAQRVDALKAGMEAVLPKIEERLSALEDKVF